ncbi:MAG: hypothetical protein NZ484_01340 [Patescibacteria group bacterium]|nr:hypothetical protein [Patescibacteria group bacterium]MDW8279656.1 hypothetical protein [bacterium]
MNNFKNKILILLIILLILVFLAINFYKKLSFQNQNIENSQNNKQDQLKIEEGIVLRNSKLVNIYDLQNQNQINLNQLPPKLGFLMIPNLQNILVFKDEKNNYLIKGQFIGKKLDDVYRDIIIYFQNLNFEFLNGSRTERFGLLEFKYYDIELKINLRQNEIEGGQNIVNCEIYVL